MAKKKKVNKAAIALLCLVVFVLGVVAGAGVNIFMTRPQSTDIPKTKAVGAVGGEIDVEISPESVSMVLTDKGPGIPDVELAMKEGYSTAPDNVRSLGFGAGMGLPNIKKYTDEAMNKLLGPVYNKVQSRLRRKIEEPTDLLFKPKPKYVPQTTGKKHHHNARKDLSALERIWQKILGTLRLSAQLKTKHNMK